MLCILFIPVTYASIVTKSFCPLTVGTHEQKITWLPPMLAILAIGKWMASTGTKYILEARCSPWWNFLCCSGVSHLLMGTTMSVPFPHVSSGSSNISISAHNPKFQSNFILPTISMISINILIWQGTSI